jgi:hypothetical protein
MAGGMARESMDRPIGCPREGTFRPLMTEKGVPGFPALAGASCEVAEL